MKEKITYFRSVFNQNLGSGSKITVRFIPGQVLKNLTKERKTAIVVQKLNRNAGGAFAENL